MSAILLTYCNRISHQAVFSVKTADRELDNVRTLHKEYCDVYVPVIIIFSVFSQSLVRFDVIPIT